MSNSQLPSGLSPLELLHHVEKVVEARIGEAIDKHTLEKSHQIDTILHRLDQIEGLIRSGFPGGDPDGHRRVHEQYIKEAAERDALMLGAKKKVVEMSIWGAIVILGMAMLDYIKSHVLK